MRPTLASRAGPGWVGAVGVWAWGERLGWGGQRIQEDSRVGAKEVADRNRSTEPFPTVPKWLKYSSAPRRCS